MMDKAGGLTFYRTSQNHPLLFWAFSTTCISTIAVINLPRFNRDDTLDPQRRDVRATWCVRPDPLPPHPSLFYPCREGGN